MLWSMRLGEALSLLELRQNINRVDVGVKLAEIDSL